MAVIQWDKVGQNASESSNFIKIEDGGTVSVVLIGFPTQYTQATFKDGDAFFSWGINEADIPYFADKSVNVNTRYAIVVWDIESKSHKVLESGAQIFKQLSALIKAGINPDQHIFKISRNGTGLATKYTVIYLPLKEQINTEHSIDIDAAVKITSVSDILAELEAHGYADIDIKPMSLIEAGEYKIGFGKFKGKTLREIKEEDKTYLSFLAKGASDLNLKAALKAIMAV